MADYEPGRTNGAAPDPTQNHYIMSEQTEFEWRVLVEAMRCAYTLCEGFADDRVDLDPLELGALFHVFSEHAATLAAQATFRPVAERMA